MGHNDLMPGFPGITIRGLEQEAEASGGWVAPVPLDDARANVADIAERCGVMLVMAEYVRGQEPMMATYAQALADVPGVTVVDATAVLSPLPARRAMVDTVHPRPPGHKVPGRLVAPPALSWPLAALVASVYAVIFGSWWTAIFGGTVLGYLGYDWMHYYTHHAKPKNPFGRFMRRFHFEHHFGTAYSQFGLSSPLWDLFLGSFWTTKALQRKPSQTRDQGTSS